MRQGSRRLLVFLVLFTGLSTAAASDELTISEVRWGGTLQAYSYRESQMRLTGPTLGVRAEGNIGLGGESFRAQAELTLGRFHYTSPLSGELSGTKWLGTQWHVSYKVDGPAWMPRPGIAFSTEWSDLRGRTSTGNPGYERFNASVWLSGAWDIAHDETDGPTVLRAALLVRGWQRSLLSQARRDFVDVTNQQSRGIWLAAEKPMRLGDYKTSVRLGWRLVGRSDTRSASNTEFVFEPTNRAIEASVTFWH